MSAGIHGEEPGGVEGLLLFLETAAHAFRERLAFEVYPCLNPYGYERHLRTNRAGADPNRLFREPQDPLSDLLRRTIGERRFEIFVDIHEDEDFEAFYLYETVEGRPPFAPRVRDRMGKLGAWAVEADDPVIRDGIVRDGWEGRMPVRTFIDGADRWPFDYLLYGWHTPRVVTIETPGKRPLELRARMQREGITAVLELLLEELASLESGSPGGAA